MLTELSPSLAFVISSLVKSVSDALLIGSYRNLEQSGNLDNQNRLVDSTSLISLFLRGKVTAAELETELGKDGYSPDNVQKLILASQNLANLSTLVDARGCCLKPGCAG